MLQFLKSISLSKYTLPVVSSICVLLWFVSSPESGLGPFIGGALMSVCIVYLIAELNNRNALLRNGSRMHSCMAIILITVFAQLHTFSIYQVIVVLIIFTLHLLCSTVQVQSPVWSFLIYLLLSVSSLFYFKILFLLPVYWGCMIYMRSMSGRCFAASLLALVVPYWFSLGYFVYKTDYQTVAYKLTNMFVFPDPDYGSVTLLQLIQFVYIVLVLLVGIINFYSSRYYDKSKIRIIYTAFIFQALALLLFIILQPQDFYIILPLLIVYVSVITGHFFALTFTKYSHIASLVFLVLSLLVFFISNNSELLTTWNL